jgi:hypothetical protein
MAVADVGAHGLRHRIGQVGWRRWACRGLVSGALHEELHVQLLPAL